MIPIIDPPPDNRDRAVVLEIICEAPQCPLCGSDGFYTTDARKVRCSACSAEVVGVEFDALSPALRRMVGR